MLAFTNTEVTKPELITVLENHKKQDAFEQGGYWDGSKGCAVGCSLQNFNKDSSDHGAYEKLFGIPRILARLEDRIFEGLSVEKSKDWPLNFTNAVPVGKDLSGVYPLFQIWLLVDPDHGVIRFAKTDEQRKVIQDSADLFLQWPNIDKEKALQVRSAAAYAADAAAADAAAAAAAAYAAAAYAAYAAAYAAAAYADAAYADAAAADAAAAAYADAAYADAAYAADARKNHYSVMADKLIELIKAA